ncbi:cytochrome P450 [Lindgomyces ingoldianus]|uniref:Cytochrome P450 n=1 Tax=Lindgomyces ingoldianus TaxID=673940 RepID=A0ACB6RIB7_9PLEO|nr:cytochrome P450 [Lindgomyces ingoldianus]KAF2478257.1 cytochrome P450 [Lindgomyces ingoldianus]
MAFIQILILAAVLFWFAQLRKLSVNYRNARKTGLRVICAPLDPYSLSFQVLTGLFRPVIMQLPDFLTLGIKVMDFEWSWKAGDTVHKELGLNFIIATPSGNVLVTADPVALAYMLQRRKEFIKPDLYSELNVGVDEYSEIMDIFGRNVDTVNGEEWARQRKLTAPCFNERVSGLVWDESLRQARSMLSSWLSSPDNKVSNMPDDTRTVALHVLSAAGLGISHDFSAGMGKPAKNHSMSHRESLMTILHNLVTVLLVSQMGDLAPLLPKKLQNIRLAIKEFGQYMDEMIAHERDAMEKDQGLSKPNLISTLIRTSDQSKDEGVNSTVRLTDEEIKGNIFIFNFAGHDTTANTLAYAISLLAVYPEIQEWVAEEVDQVLGKEDYPIYEEAYPKLKRVQAVMYETLRLYGPAPLVPRGILNPNTPIHLTNPNDPLTPTIIIPPPNTQISLNYHGSHTSSSVFPTPQSFTPSRWIQANEHLNDEVLLPAPLGYQAWSLGPRVCPGMKFSQVEFTAVLATVLRGSRVEPSTESNPKGKKVADLEVCRKEVLALVRDSGLFGGTLSMRKPGDLCLKIVGR